MKSNYFLILVCLIGLFGISATNATVYTVQVASNSFTPATVNAVCGDTIKWVYVNGFHTTTSTTIPSGATAWDAPMQTGGATFIYVVSKAGTYNYKCSPHGFTGTIVVTCSVGPTLYTVQVGNNSFTPSTVNAVCGDTIKWVYVDGFHTTTSTTIPGGATTWDAAMQTSGATFLYVVTKAGTYNYKCSPHGFTGQIVVSCNTTMDEFNFQTRTVIYPNPFSERVFIETTNTDNMLIYNILGKQVFSTSLSPGSNRSEMNLGYIPIGIYFYSILKNEEVVSKGKLVKN